MRVGAALFEKKIVKIEDFWTFVSKGIEQMAWESEAETETGARAMSQGRP